MREIIFRGQTRRNGEKVWMDGKKVPSNWVYGGVLQGTGSFSIIYGCNDVDDKHASNLEKHVVYTDTLGQYTGLTAKNGKIFEGDIVQYYGTYALEVYIENGHTKTRWFDTVTKREYTELFFGYDEEAYGECEIIGNIHDNPELLKGETE